MGKIRELPKEIVLKIAAGEVIERPSSIVRELIDNSIDAKANNISIRVWQGGIERIEVVDNGEGMDEEDLRNCYKPHTTSKITKLEDLFHISTLGFRGEALSSIAQVSILEIISKPSYKNTPTGYRIVIEFGKEKEFSPCPSPIGTKVIVKDLFKNLPARLKFLKTPQKELSYIREEIIKKAIPFHDIHFSLLVDGKKDIVLPPRENLEKRIYDLFPDLKDKLISAYLSPKESLRTFALLSPPTLTRASREYQMLFVNGRAVESKLLYDAIYSAYSGYLEPRKFPVVFFFLTIDPQLVDVNVHPAKKEIKFREEGMVYYFMVETLKKGLSTLKTSVIVQPSERIQKDIERIERLQLVSPPSPTQQELGLLSTNAISMKATEETYTQVGNFRIIGTVFDTFILVEDINRKELVIIDQHVAHERIIYNKLTRNFLNSHIPSQKLLKPTLIELPKNLMDIAVQNINTLEKFGFTIKPIEGRILIEGIPAPLERWNVDDVDLLVEILEKINESGEVPSVWQNVFALIACKSAVKAHQKLSPEEIKKLVEDILKEDNPYTCPHGRPIMIKITKDFFEKLFERKV